MSPRLVNVKCSNGLKIFSKIVLYVLLAPIYATLLAWHMLWVRFRFNVLE